IIAFINYVRELPIFAICHLVKLSHSPQYITTAQGGGFLGGNKYIAVNQQIVLILIFSIRQYPVLF
ncbi:MAG: hypothetical protein ABI308_17205, partial [Mucilaginibacter sp.]